MPLPYRQKRINDTALQGASSREILQKMQHPFPRHGRANNAQEGNGEVERFRTAPQGILKISRLSTTGVQTACAHAREAPDFPFCIWISPCLGFWETREPPCRTGLVLPRARREGGNREKSRRAKPDGKNKTPPAQCRKGCGDCRLSCQLVSKSAT